MSTLLPSSPMRPWPIAHSRSLPYLKENQSKFQRVPSLAPRPINNGDALLSQIYILLRKTSNLVSTILTTRPRWIIIKMLDKDHLGGSELIPSALLRIGDDRSSQSSIEGRRKQERWIRLKFLSAMIKVARPMGEVPWWSQLYEMSRHLHLRGQKVGRVRRLGGDSGGTTWTSYLLYLSWPKISPTSDWLLASASPNGNIPLTWMSRSLP